MAEVVGRIRQANFVPKRWLITSAIVLLIFVIFPFVAGTFQTNLMAKLLLFGTLGVSLDLIWGFTGILSFAHGVFFTLGGYAMAYYLKLNLSATANNYGGTLPDFMVWNGLKELPWFIAPLQYFPIAVIATVVIPAGFAYAIGSFIFRSKVSGVYITVITLAISSALTTFFVSQQAYTGGTNGITDVSKLILFGAEVPPIGLYFIILLFATLVIAGGWWLTQSNFGLILRSIKENEKRISFLGYDVASFKIFIWTLSAAIAGIAGGLFVPLNNFISPVYLNVAFGTQVVIWVAVGGRGTLFGPIIAAILLGQIQNSVDRITQDWQLIVGVILMVVVLFLPDGLMSLIPKKLLGKKNNQLERSS
ncbi:MULTISPECIES: urea ABC transporter permease subunit UrtC [Pseudanabaena]|uniref:Urea ABC transporter, permease protein UrtC n=2 Tax=Pseudanabaena TaxID=1152 RepID=L8N300_9CYAN|nr:MULTISPECIES: urea ABC transporter permease subunit UrtC [Pseudanabaena]ELS34066.1 urea ABC transporter, permease protein UrtC [Pseudanabaena biceps PCC 7429]MDG3493728.1 urea ABC transporter permease subunit UrtC [Pseudanabaena catenata USMAC16]